MVGLALVSRTPSDKLKEQRGNIVLPLPHFQQPFSGKLLLRVPPELHTRARVAAQVAGISLNQWAAKALKQATQN